MTALLVALGAAVGAAARYLVGQALPGRRGTLLVNVLGSFALGVVSARTTPTAASYALLATGFCGAFTTFSAFALEAQEGQSKRYVALSLALCVTAAAVGLRT